MAAEAGARESDRLGSCNSWVAGAGKAHIPCKLRNRTLLAQRHGAQRAAVEQGNQLALNALQGVNVAA
jgi:hypothetical protein